MSEPAEHLPRLYVGVGASAGGLEAFKALLAALPADSGMSFVFVQHLAPDHNSLLVEFLGKDTDMPVRPVEHGQQLKRDHIYVIQPDTDVLWTWSCTSSPPRTRSRTRCHTR